MSNLDAAERDMIARAKAVSIEARSNPWLRDWRQHPLQHLKILCKCQLHEFRCAGNEPDGEARGSSDVYIVIECARGVYVA
jgi:hypothetical protein